MYSLPLARPHSNLTFSPTLSPSHPPSLSLPPSSSFSSLLLSFPPTHSLLRLFLPPLSPFLSLSQRVLVGRRKKAIMLLGGSWCADLDGGDPLQVQWRTQLSAVQCSGQGAGRLREFGSLYLDLFLPNLKSLFTS
jgi:hypothetical protein